LRRETYSFSPPLLISPDGGIHKGIKIGPNLEQNAKKVGCYTKDPAKELEERKRFGIAAAAREILKEMLSLPLYMYQE
jgi:hypothetical protein